MINNPLPQPTISFTGGVVFNGTSPLAWTDLDLSAVIGAYQCEVVLKAYQSDTGDAIAFRTNGDTDEFYDLNGRLVAQGCSAFCGGANYKLVLAISDAAGIIEWMATAGRVNTTVEVISWKRT